MYGRLQLALEDALVLGLVPLNSSELTNNTNKNMTVAVTFFSLSPLSLSLSLCALLFLCSVWDAGAAAGGAR